MFRHLKVLIGGCLFAGLVGCTATSPVEKAAVAWRTHLIFQPVSDLVDPPEVVVHQVSIDRKGSSFPLLGQIEVEDEKFVCAGITPSGVRVFLLQLDAEGMTYESHPLMPRGMKGKYLLGDLQTIFWPVESLRAGGLSVNQPDANTREIYRGRRKMISIHYENPDAPWQSVIRYQHHQRKYTITLEPVE